MHKPLIFLSLLTPSLLAQDFEKIAPDTIRSESTTLNKLFTNSPQPNESNDKSVILPTLRGVTFATKESEISSRALSKKGVQIAEDTIMQKKGFQKLVNKHIGKPLSMHSMSKLSNQIVAFYRKNNAPVVDVIIPEQDITNGVLQLLVIEGKLNKVRVTGNKYFSKKAIKSNIRANKGHRIDSRYLLDDINWINTNPFIDARPILAPGKQAYTTDVIIKVKDKLPLRNYLGYENSGNELTGSSRYIAGINAGNMFGLGHQLNYQITWAEDFDKLNAHSFLYSAPLEWRHTLDIYGSYTNSSTDSGPFTIDGRSKELGVIYSIPLTAAEDFSHEIYGGLIVKNSENALEFGLIPASSAETTTNHLKLGYRGSKFSKQSTSTFDLSLAYSPGGIFDHGSDDDFAFSRQGASNHYFYNKLRLSHQHRLPSEMTWSSELTAQWSNENLLSSEQLSIGGYSSIRGYDERELNNTDSGFILRNELRFPEMSLPKIADNKWQFLCFSDYAWATANSGKILLSDGSEKSDTHLWSVGTGLRLSMGKSFKLRADYGFQLEEVGSKRDSGKLHVGCTLAL